MTTTGYYGYKFGGGKVFGTRVPPGWGIVVFVFVLLLLLLLWGCLRCCYWGLCYHCCCCHCRLCLVICIVIVGLSMSLLLLSYLCRCLKKSSEKSHRFSLFPQLDSGHRGDPGEFLHYSRNPAAIIVNNQVDHQSDNSDNSQ